MQVIVNLRNNAVVLACKVNTEEELVEAAKRFESLHGGTIDLWDLQPQAMPNGTSTQILIFNS